MTTLTMNGPVAETAVERGVQGVLGKPLDRIEGPLKVSGRAEYSYEIDRGAAFGFLVTAEIARGRVVAIRPQAALTIPGVLLVLDAGERTPVTSALSGDKKPQQGNVEVKHYGQPLLLVVATSFEAARDAALRIEIDYEPADGAGRFDMDVEQEKAVLGKDWMFPSTVTKGNVQGALAAAPVTLDATYKTPAQMHAALEPHATTAEWDGDQLIVYGSYQMLAPVKAQLANALGIAEHRVRVVAHYVGGGFGSKLGLSPETVLAALAAKEIGRPVKVALTRQQVFHATSRRSGTIQRIRLAAGRDGRLTAIDHDTIATNLPGYTFWEPAGAATISLYAAPNRSVTHRIAELDVVTSGAMRAPGEAVGMLALENAMDEMAEKLGMDPIEFRRVNEPDQDPQLGISFSSRKLLACLDEGARRFGWNARKPEPASTREGEWLIGLGVAAAARKNLLEESTAIVRITPDGRATVETDMTDIGTGSYTILAQVAAEALGLPIERVDVHLGDTHHPVAAGSGGSWGAASSGSSVLLACEGLIAKLARQLDAQPRDVTLQDGMVTAGNRRTPLADLVGPDGIEATGTIKPGATLKTHRQVSYGAHFAEVAVSSVTGEVRLRRMLGIFAAGRILNEKTAISQCIGGMIFGIGAALSEELVIDHRHGHFVNHDLAEYHVPVHADVPAIEAAFLPERDLHANPLQAKGIGELGISGAGAAITNAIYNATGIRVRDYPVTLDKLLDRLPPG